jgi:chromosome partitioning protein
VWIVTLAQLKGGSAKTTTVVHLALALARHGRVLVVDTDHQAAATHVLTQRCPPAHGTLALLLEGARLDQVVAATPWGVDLVGASKDLARAELALAPRIGRETLLRTALRTPVDAPWDVCLIDTPPSIGLMTANALVAADALLAPVVPAFLSLLALEQLEEAVGMVRALNPDLHDLGYLLCAVDGRERLSAEARDALRAHAGDALWRQQVRVDVRLKTRLDEHALRGRGAEDYVAVASELRRRLAKLPSKQAPKPPSKPASKPPSEQVSR